MNFWSDATQKREKLLQLLRTISVWTAGKYVQHEGTTLSLFVTILVLFLLVPLFIVSSTHPNWYLHHLVCYSKSVGKVTKVLTCPLLVRAFFPPVSVRVWKTQCEWSLGSEVILGLWCIFFGSHTMLDMYHDTGVTSYGSVLKILNIESSSLYCFSDPVRGCDESRASLWKAGRISLQTGTPWTHSFTHRGNFA